MTRYIALPRRPRAEWDDLEPVVTTTTVLVEDDEPEPTGLYNAQGVPLYRVREKIKIGFVR